MAEIQVLFEFKEYRCILRTAKPRLSREVEHHLRRVFGFVQPYVLSSCPSAELTDGITSSTSRSSPFYLQRYNAQFSTFINVDSVEEIMEGDRITVIQLTDSGSTDLASGSFKQSSRQSQSKASQSSITVSTY